MSAAGVSRLLASRGFDRASSEATSVRGWRRYSPGFRVLAGEGQSVLIEHETLDSYENLSETQTLLTPAERRDVALQKYAGALREAGLTVSREQLARSRSGERVGECLVVQP